MGGNQGCGRLLPLNVDIAFSSLFSFFQEPPGLQRKCLFPVKINSLMCFVRFLRTKGWDPVTGQYSYSFRIVVDAYLILTL